MRRRTFFRHAVTGAASLGGAAAAHVTAQSGPTERAGGRKPRILFYHDGRHPLIYMYEPPMQKEEFEAAVDELLGTPIEAIMFCLGDGRTVLHDTKVGELWGHNVRKWPHAIFRRAHQNARALIDAGHEPLRIVCDRAHAKGLLLYPTLLVQQGSGERGTDVRGSDFRFNNKHLEIGARGGIDPKFPKHGLACLDFKHKEVRDERLALIQETLTRYPVDGFELQLNYVPYYFRPDELEHGRKIMTDWIAEVNRAVKASGPNRELVVRVPASLEGCWSVGLDLQEWIRRGIVDVIAAQTFSGPELVDMTADFRPIVKAARGSRTRIHATIQSHIDSDRLSEAPIEMIRATACNYHAQGIDGLYLAHWFNNWLYQASFYEKLREVPHPDVMAPKDKFYFVPTTTNRYSEPALEPGIKMQLPLDLAPNQTVAVEWTVTDDLERWNKVKRVHDVLLRVRILNTSELDQLSFRFNDRTLPAGALRKLNEMYKMQAPRYRVFGYWFIWHLPREHWPVLGRNRIEVTLTRRDLDLIPQVVLRDVELEIKYLMGRNFHRGQDPDLGPAQPGSSG